MSITETSDSKSMVTETLWFTAQAVVLEETKYKITQNMDSNFVFITLRDPSEKLGFILSIENGKALSSLIDRLVAVYKE